jgi:meiosis induction protein kinase IME2/SME1
MYNRQAAGSLSSFHLAGISSSKLASHSNPSFETQFANDFASRAKVASGSSPALGSMSNNSGVFLSQVGNHGQGSVPTSPYGHPKGAAVAHGVGMGRHAGGGSSSGVMLPSIRSWEEENGQNDGKINPMFRVVSLADPYSVPGLITASCRRCCTPSGRSAWSLPTSVLRHCQSC